MACGAVMKATPNSDRATSVHRFDASDVAVLVELLAEVAEIVTDPFLCGRVAGMLDRRNGEGIADAER